MDAEDGLPDGPQEDARLLSQRPQASRRLKKLALKVDVDTYRGTLEGVPRLVDLFQRHGVKATFFFSLGPDTSGKAIKRVFRKGFIRKVLSASPAASYGLRTMLYGTLLPAPDIGGRKETVTRMREAAAAGHAIGIHAWDHVDWHDRLPKMTRDEIEEIVANEHARFARDLRERARVSGGSGLDGDAAFRRGAGGARRRRDLGYARRRAVLSDSRGRNGEQGARDSLDAADAG